MKFLNTLGLALLINVVVLGVASAEHDYFTHIEDYSHEVTNTETKGGLTFSSTHQGAYTAQEEYSTELDLPSKEDYASRVASTQAHNEQTHLLDYATEIDVKDSLHQQQLAQQ